MKYLNKKRVQCSLNCVQDAIARGFVWIPARSAVFTVEASRNAYNARRLLGVGTMLDQH